MHSLTIIIYKIMSNTQKETNNLIELNESLAWIFMIQLGTAEVV